MKKTRIILSAVFSLTLSLAPLQVFALSEEDWDFFDNNYIFYYDPSGNNCESGTISFGDNHLYDGRQILSDYELHLVTENKPIYERVANKYGIKWQILATLHYKEHSLKRDNPANGQGIYQLYSYTAGGTNENAFRPSGAVSFEEFERQTEVAARLLVTNYGLGLNLDTDNGIKKLFFKYNGQANGYISQARDLGFSDEEARNGEGSPYVMNLADSRRDSSKNPNWKGIKTDGGGLNSPAGNRPGAFLVYSALGGSNGVVTCSSANSGDINQTAINLAWPEPEYRKHSINEPRDTYRTALAAVGLNRYGESMVQIGASCDAFVTTVMRYSGADPDFKCCGIRYRGGNSTYTYVTTSSKYIEVPNNKDSLQPGDIRMSEKHIELVVRVNGVLKIASASHGERTGEISNFYPNSPEFKAYRLVK